MGKWRPVLDRVEQLILLVGGIWLFTRLWPADFSYASFNTYLLLFSEGIAILFVLLRKETGDISIRVRDWTAAIVGSAGPLFVGAGGASIAYDVGIILLSAGIFIHIGAKLSLNRSFGIVAANRGVKSQGLYRIVRHPMYFGYMVTHAGFLLAAPSWRNALVYLTVWSAFILRLMAEEKILIKDPAYQTYMTRTRWRVIPFVF